MMPKRNIVFFITLMFFFFPSCKNIYKPEKEESTNNTQAPLLQRTSKDTIPWIAHFRTFRDAVYRGKKEVVKEYVNFPINDEANSYSEANFEKDFKQIFPKEFTQSILKIKTQKLYESGAFETPFIKKKDGQFKAIVNYNKKDSTLSIHVYMETDYKIGKGKEMTIEHGESSLIYTFKLSTDNKPMLTGIMMAG